MTSDNVIELFPTIPEMEAEMNKWQLLTYDEKKRSNDACIELHGCTNEELYARQYAFLQSMQDTEEIQEAVETCMPSNLDNIETGEWKGQYIQDVLAQDPNIIIITDDDTIDGLNAKYNDYLMLTPQYRTLSDEHHIKLYGMNFIQKYNERLGTLSSVKGSNFEIDEMIQANKDALNASNFIEFCTNKINCITAEKTLVESCVLSEKVLDSKFVNRPYDDSCIPSLVPFYTLDEYKELNPDKSDMMFLEYFRIDDKKKYYDTICELYNQTKNESTKAEATSRLIKLGWCPFKEPNGESIKESRTRQLEWMNTHFNLINLIDLSKYELLSEVKGIEGDKKRLEPIFITFTAGVAQFSKVIMKFTNSDFSHSGISLDSSMKKIISYNMAGKKFGGLSEESIEKYIEHGIEHFKVLVLFVDKDAKKKMKEEIDIFLNNKTATRYGFEDFFNIVFNIPAENRKTTTMVCSQFVDYILKIGGIDLTNKPSNLVSPENLNQTLSTDGVNVYQLFDGDVKKYKEKDIKNKIKFILSALDYEELVAVTANVIADKIKDNRVMELFNMTCSDNLKVNSILREMREYIKPTVVPALTLDRTIIDKQNEEKFRVISNELNSCGTNDIEKIEKLLIELKAFIKNDINPYHNNEIYNNVETLYRTYFSIVNIADPAFVNKLMCNVGLPYDGSNLLQYT